MAQMKVRKPAAQEIVDSKLWSTWSKEPSVFDWHYSNREFCYILEGEASVSDTLGNTIQFKAGDFVIFEQGLQCVWEIRIAIKKKYIFE